MHGKTILINATVYRKLASATSSLTEKTVEKITAYFLLFKHISHSSDIARRRYQNKTRAKINDQLRMTPNSKKTTTKRKAPICSVCEKTVRIKSKRMISTYCKLLINLHCTNTKSLTISNTENTKEWICFSCASIELPFHQVKDELSTNIKSSANYTNEHLENLDELKHVSICHLNTQLMSSPFDEFQYMINQSLMLLHHQKRG